MLALNALSDADLERLEQISLKIEGGTLLEHLPDLDFRFLASISLKPTPG